MAAVHNSNLHLRVSVSSFNAVDTVTVWIL